MFRIAYYLIQLLFIGYTTSLNVHFIVHSHDVTVSLIPVKRQDAGWKKTVDEYYVGFDVAIPASVQWTLDSATMSLSEEPHRKFVFAEIAFFKR